MSSSCTCGDKYAAHLNSETVTPEAFRSLRRHVRELSEIVQALTEQRGEASPAAFSARSVRRGAEGLGIKERAAPPALAVRSTRIVGGRETDRFPHCAFIGRQISGVAVERWDWFCTGVLIHPRVVLSAAHCQPNQPNVVALNTRGLHDLGGGIEKLTILKSFIHPSYRPSAGIEYHDIVIHILKEAARTPPVDVAGQEDLANATQVTLAGFGNDDIRSTRGFGVKREVTVDIRALRRDNENLDDQEGLFGFESDNEFVAGSPVMDSCNGDSGGPAYIAEPTDPSRWLVAGLTSRGIREPFGDETPCGDGGIYTRIDVHWDWIREVAKKYLK